MVSNHVLVAFLSYFGFMCGYVVTSLVQLASHRIISSHVATVSITLSSHVITHQRGKG